METPELACHLPLSRTLVGGRAWLPDVFAFTGVSGPEYLVRQCTEALEGLSDAYQNESRFHLCRMLCDEFFSQ